MQEWWRTYPWLPMVLCGCYLVMCYVGPKMMAGYAHPLTHVWRLAMSLIWNLTFVIMPVQLQAVRPARPPGLLEPLPLGLLLDRRVPHGALPVLLAEHHRLQVSGVMVSPVSLSVCCAPGLI